MPTMNILKQDLKELYLYATVFIELISDTQYDFGPLKKIYGHSTSELVFKNGDINNTTDYFINNDTGKIWPGAVHFHEGTGWMAGAQHTQGSHPTLTKVSMNNPKIIYLNEGI